MTLKEHLTETEFDRLYPKSDAHFTLLVDQNVPIIQV